jgi:hypothetical protein
MPRHGMQYCLLCNPLGNGTEGEDGTEAIGKYYVEDIPGEDQHTTGWHGVCADCAEIVAPTNDVQPLPGHEDHPFFADGGDGNGDVTHDCDDPTWTKHSLVTEDAGFDWVQCECSIWAKRWGVNRIEIVGDDGPEGT